MTAEALIAHGVPPFYMIAFAVGGAPTTTLIGTNESELKWKVDHPVEGTTSECIAPAPTEPEFTISANVTDVLSTCQPWGLTIRGGTPPYNLTLAVLNASDVTNVTLGANDSVYTYINRAEPDSQMIGRLLSPSFRTTDTNSTASISE
ncbi:hypothetical protein C8R44DRAFT_601861 [Mycena epipterygia]|nr:hypothetical protein C8R44DRAFT_601861 [Mycena epipterygia]